MPLAQTAMGSSLLAGEGYIELPIAYPGHERFPLGEVEPKRRPIGVLGVTYLDVVTIIHEPDLYTPVLLGQRALLPSGSQRHDDPPL